MKGDCHRAPSRNLNAWQPVPVRDYSNAERTCLTPLLVNLESMTSRPSAVGGSKDCVTWKVEESHMHYFVHACKITTDSSTD